MHFRRFLDEEYLNDEYLNEGLLVEKVTKETNSMLKPYTKDICRLLSVMGYDAQSPSTNFIKLDASTIDKMTSSSGTVMFNYFKNVVKDKINDSPMFIATANNKNGLCKTAVVFSLDKKKFIY